MKFSRISMLGLAALLLGLVDAKKVTDPKKPPKNAVLLSTVNSLTLRSGKQTSARRSSAVPQLKCSGPSHVCKLYSVDVMRCTNEGGDYDAGNIQWSCKANLPVEFKLGSTEVGCEGYESSEDPFVLRGSCGVEYRLLLTEEGEAKYGIKGKTLVDEDLGSKLFGFIFILLFLGVIFLILRSIYNSWNDPNRPRAALPGTGWGGGGGGGGGRGGYDPPPPYDDHSAPPRKPRTYTPRASSSRTGQGSQAAGEQWRPGFWTGAAAGAAGGYAAASYANRNRGQPAQPETRQTGGGWFGGGGRSTAGPSSSAPSYSSGRHESTGFGGTSRR